MDAGLSSGHALKESHSLLMKKKNAVIGLENSSSASVVDTF